MQYIKRFNEAFVSIFDNRWTEVIPKKLDIKTSNGEFQLSLHPTKSNLGHQTNVTNVMNWINICYNQPTTNDDSEPDYLCFDISLLKTNDGYQSDPKDLKLSVDITYGDSMMYEFDLEMPNKVKVFHYDGYGSKYDPEYYFGFSDKTVKDLVKFFNSFGFQYSEKDFTFLDEHLDSYRPNF